LVDEGLTIVKAVRSRHDGIRRNPLNEVECGNHYARSLASYGVLTALCGFHCDLPHGRISFSPRINADDFRAFFATGKGWGIYTRRVDENGLVQQNIEVLYGNLDDVEYA
jgi:non-lysosomal glucosylceramidase